MARTQFENQLRDKINKREMKPSPQAWDRLDAMLSVAEEKQPKKSYNWLFIAASFLGFLLFASIFFSNIQTVTDAPKKNVVIENQNPVKLQDEVKTATPSASQTAIAAAETPNKKSSNNNNHQSKSIINQTIKGGNVGAVSFKNVELSEQYPELAASTNSNGDLPKNQAKVDELLAQVSQAQVKPKTSVNVNAKNLLQEVDNAVNLSFREKMLRRAGEVAETVANRNNE